MILYYVFTAALEPENPLFDNQVLLTFHCNWIIERHKSVHRRKTPEKKLSFEEKTRFMAAFPVI